MPYSSVRGRRPAEAASKSAHGHIINDPSVQAFLGRCNIPKKADEVSLDRHLVLPFVPVEKNPIRHIIAVDSGFTEVPVQSRFPSAKICFFQFGALAFAIDDLLALDRGPFIDPDDISKLKQIERLQLTLPLRNVQLKGEPTLTASVRKAVYEFFRQKLEDRELIETIRWLLYQEYGRASAAWTLASCPTCGQSRVALRRGQLSSDYTVPCENCGELIYLTDVFRLHEAIDDEMGAGGIVGYVTTAFEQVILAHLIRVLLDVKPGALREVLFIKDGPLAFFGQTANIHRPMRWLVAHLLATHDLFLAGLEKSGPFVEHAHEVFARLDPGTMLILDNNYIYEYILPGKADAQRPYGGTTYYSSKVIFKTHAGSMHVVSIPTVDAGLSHPKKADLPNLDAILTNVEILRCDMYDNALIPVALANKLVSLAAHPSSRVLQKFAADAVLNHL
jgi:hypothetical protein